MYLIPFIVPDNFTIKGEVDIVVNIIEPTTNITVHIYDMTIHEDRVKITFGGNTDIPVVLQKVPSEANPKVRNHGEGPY